ncbi:MAG: TonB-dependent receptor, partial [bacterium]|nr:TonB-dependent receptor [bacterium]
AVTASAEVIAATPLLETESNTVGQLIERPHVEHMPLQSRRSAGLVRLMGNVTYGGDPGSEAAPRYTMAGGRPVNQMTLLDGGVVQNMTLGVPQQLVNPPAESLQEFRISASNHSAEFGRAGSGLVLMTTRSGTNEYHGSGYWFLRNDKMDARSFFAKEKEPLRFNIFGASIGGPIAKDKSFFFVNYEGSRRRAGRVFAGREVPHPADA